MNNYINKFRQLLALPFLLFGQGLLILSLFIGGKETAMALRPMLNSNTHNTFWFIWSIEHNGWWKANRVGYTQNLEEAGLYSYEQALAIVDDANRMNLYKPNEAMVRVHVVSGSVG